jgi:hypothetical protein
MSHEYPNWICNACGLRHGRKRAGEGTTWHHGKCDVCQQPATVTEPRDFGHLTDWLPKLSDLVGICKDNPIDVAGDWEDADEASETREAE